MSASPVAPREAASEPVHNRDLAPRPGARSCEIRALTDNQTISDAFAVYETSAKRLKRRYEAFGRLSVAGIGISAIYTAFRSFMPLWIELDIGAVLLGASGIGLDLYIRRSNLKLRWLINRFGAERIRSAKFQLYVLAACATSKEELDEAVPPRTELLIDRIAQELCFPLGALNSFHGPTALQLDPPPGSKAVRGMTSLLQAAIEDYREWRIAYQHAFAQQMSKDIADRQRGFDSLSDALFVLGAAVLVASVAVRLMPSVYLGPFAHWGLPALLEALGLALFIGTAIANVLSAGASHLPSNSRYQQYARDLSRLLDVEPKSADQFVRLVEKMELIALRELDDFWRDIWISSYRT